MNVVTAAMFLLHMLLLSMTSVYSTPVPKDVHIHVDASAGSGNNQGMIQAEDAKLGEVKQETDYNKPLFETDYIATGNESGNRKKKKKAPKHLRKKSKKGNKYWWGGYGGWYGGWWYPYGGWWWKK